MSWGRLSSFDRGTSSVLAGLSSVTAVLWIVKVVESIWYQLLICISTSDNFSILRKLRLCICRAHLLLRASMRWRSSRIWEPALLSLAFVKWLDRGMSLWLLDVVWSLGTTTTLVSYWLILAFAMYLMYFCFLGSIMLYWVDLGSGYSLNWFKTWIAMLRRSWRDCLRPHLRQFRSSQRNWC